MSDSDNCHEQYKMRDVIKGDGKLLKIGNQGNSLIINGKL